LAYLNYKLNGRSIYIYRTFHFYHILREHVLEGLEALFAGILQQRLFGIAVNSMRLEPKGSPKWTVAGKIRNGPPNMSLACLMLLASKEDCIGRAAEAHSSSM